MQQLKDLKICFLILALGRRSFHVMSEGGKEYEKTGSKSKYKVLQDRDDRDFSELRHS